MSEADNTLQRLQNMCVRPMLKQDYRLPTVDLHTMANLLTLKQHRYKNTALIMYQVMSGLAPVYISNMFMKRIAIHLSVTHSSVETCLYPPKFKLQWSKRSFRQRGYSVWESLPDDIKKSTSVETFKSNIYLFHQNYNV